MMESFVEGELRSRFVWTVQNLCLRKDSIDVGPRIMQLFIKDAF